MRETYLRLNRAANSDCEFLWSSIFYLYMWISNAFLGHQETKIPVPPNISFLKGHIRHFMENISVWCFRASWLCRKSIEWAQRTSKISDTNPRKILSYKIFPYQRKKYFQVNSQNRPVANLPVFNFRSQPQKKSLSHPLNE